MQHFDYVYVSSYNECDARFVTGLAAACQGQKRTFAVVGYVSKYVEDLYRELEVPFFNIRAEGPLKRLDPSERRALEQRLPTTLPDFVFAEQRYYMSSGDKVAGRTAAVMDGFDRLLRNISIGSFIHKLGAEIIRRVAVLTAEQHDIGTIFLGGFPAHFTGRMYLHSSIWSERDAAGPPRESSAALPRAEFDALLERIRNRREVIHYPLQGGRGVREAAGMLLSMWRRRETEFLSDILRRRIEMQRFKWWHFLGKMRAQTGLPDEPFFFFPLHVFDDSQITVRNPEFYDQSWVIALLDRVLPEGMRLVVKLHPGLDGAAPPGFIRAIGRLRRVHLLRGEVNAHRVIDASEGVIVINSTVAFEALVRRKPVLVLGHWSFGKTGMTTHISDWRQLPQALRKLRTDPVDWPRIDDILHALHGEMHEGSYNREPVDYDRIVKSFDEKRARP